MLSTLMVLPGHKAVCTIIFFCTISEGWKDHASFGTHSEIELTTVHFLNLTVWKPDRLQLNKLETKEIYLLAQYHLIDFPALHYCSAVVTCFLDRSVCESWCSGLQPSMITHFQSHSFNLSWPVLMKKRWDHMVCRSATPLSCYCAAPVWH